MGAAMKDTAEQSAELKMALKRDPESAVLAAEAEAFPVEADEALTECEQGWDTATPGSWVARRLEAPMA